MTSEIQQLLETLMDYITKEQEEFLDIIRRINNVVKDTSQGKKKNQQDGASNNNEQETTKIGTKNSIRRKKHRNIQCYNCKERRHVMKNCPYCPRVMMRESRELTTELKNALASNMGIISCSNSVHQ